MRYTESPNFTTLMLKRTAHIILAVWLAVLVLFGSTAKEFIHDFAGHRDTVHKDYEHGITIEKEHHHCAFLSFSLTAFDQHISTPVTFCNCIAHRCAYLLYRQALVQREIVRAPLRGPPAHIIV